MKRAKGRAMQMSACSVASASSTWLTKTLFCVWWQLPNMAIWRMGGLEDMAEGLGMGACGRR